MKIIDKKGRLFGRVSIVDLLIVLMVLAVGSVIYLYLFGGSGSVQMSAGQEMVTYEIELQKVTKEFTEMPEVGLPVYNSSKSYYIGQLKDYEVMPYTLSIENYDEGTFELVEAEDLYTVILTIEAVADVTDMDIRVGQQEVRIGEQVPVKSKGFAAYGYIVGIVLEGQE